MPPAATPPKRSATDLIADYHSADKLEDRSKAINGRIKALRQLAGVAGEESVPFLAGLLSNDSPPVRELALAALTADPAPAAGAAVVAALRDAREPIRQIALIQAAAVRREASAVEPLQSLAGAADEAVASAAIRALGGIGTAPAGRTLMAVQAKAAAATQQQALQACLVCADRLRERGEKEAARDLYRLVHSTAAAPHVRTSALRGLALVAPDEALPLVLRTLEAGGQQEQAQAAHITVEMPGDAVTAALMAALPKLPPAAQEFLITALADREVERKG